MNSSKDISSESSPLNNLQHFYIVVMAGGSGTRLWPLSRKNNPKQFHRLISDRGRTLLEETADRARAVLPEHPENIFFSTTSDYRDRILEIFPTMNLDNIIVEPIARGTAAAIALVATRIFARDPDALIATIASDHAIGNEDEFTRSLLAAFETVSIYPDKIVTIGINPTTPDTGLGYIRMGEKIATIRGKEVFAIDAFREKPDAKTAEQYLREWSYLWNAGYFIFSAKTFLSWLDIYTPDLAKVMKLLSEIDSPAPESHHHAETLYHPLPNVAIEPALIEKLPAENRAVIPAPIEWSDIGNWSAIADLLQKRHGVSVIARGEHIDRGSRDCLVLSSSDKLIATLGLKGIIVVETDDAILVAKKSRVGDIKNLLDKIRDEKDEHLL